MKKKSIIETFSEAREAYRLYCTTNDIEFREPFLAFTQLNKKSIRLYSRENELLARYDRKQKTIVDSAGKNRNKIGLNEINTGQPAHYKL